ncbi:MAG TPA: phosphoglycerate mutase family protein [Thermoanaerobaculia bacterium]|nr:phosphoglycerate mutase family protein [Thermoanaerobaculia bacterium]
MIAHSRGFGRWVSCRLRALPALLLLLLAAPAAGLDTIWLVRHAEKMEPWDQDLDALQPLSREGAARAEALADRLKDAGIAAIYTSRTARTIATAEPLAERGKIPLTADDATTRSSELPPLLARLRERHAGDRAVLIVGHSNTIPQILVQLGATPECFARLGVKETPEGLLIEGFGGVWRVELAKQGCAAVARE